MTPDQIETGLDKQVATLNAAATNLRDSGLEDQAKDMENQARILTKKEKLPEPGKRLDMMQSYVTR